MNSAVDYAYDCANRLPVNRLPRNAQSKFTVLSVIAGPDPSESMVENQNRDLKSKKSVTEHPSEYGTGLPGDITPPSRSVPFVPFRDLSWIFSEFSKLLVLILFLTTSISAKEVEMPRILFFGDSLTAGYGIDPDFAYPALIQEKIRQEDLQVIAVNAGLSGETSAGGLRRINWLMKKRIDYLILALGANDGLRGLDAESTATNLQSIISAVREKFPDIRIIIAGMKVPPNMGPRYTSQFEPIFARLAEENDAVLIPFLLEGVAAIPELNLPDGIHPNEEGHRVIAETVWKYLEPLIQKEL